MVSVRAKWALLIAGLTLAACAGAPKDPAAARPPAGSTPIGAASAPPPGQTASPPPAPVATASASEPAPPPGIVDVNRQPPAENGGQVCRVMLRPNTNSLVNVCGTPAQWKKYDEAEALAAQELVLRMRSAPTLPPGRAPTR